MLSKKIYKMGLVPFEKKKILNKKICTDKKIQN